ncbi:hypothetical protein Tco_0574987 [Tanacetum coccineum]
MGCRRRRKRFEMIVESKAKTTFEESTSLAKKESMDELFKLSRIQEFAKSKVSTDERNCMTKFHEFIKDSFKDFFPMESQRGEKQMFEGKSERDILRKRKANNFEEQPSKMVKANNHFRAFDTLWEILHILDRQDLYHLYRVVQDYYEHIPPTGLGLILLGDLTTIWETAEISDDDFWKNQEDWEIVKVETLIELMIRMLEHGMEVEDESEIAITLIHLFILWTTKDGDDS